MGSFVRFSASSLGVSNTRAARFDPDWFDIILSKY